MEGMHGTTIIAVRRDGRLCMGGDGQVTLGNTIVKARARKIRKVQELLGHANLSSTQVYTHLDIERLAEEYRSAHPHARRQN